MRGARALLASWGIENPTDEQFIGGLMEADFQKTVMDFIAGWVRGNNEAAKKSKRGRKR